MAIAVGKALIISGLHWVPSSSNHPGGMNLPHFIQNKYILDGIANVSPGGGGTSVRSECTSSTASVSSI